MPYPMKTYCRECNNVTTIQRKDKEEYDVVMWKAIALFLGIVLFLVIGAVIAKP